MNEWLVTVRPVKPAWANEEEHDSLVKVVRYVDDIWCNAGDETAATSRFVGYIQGWVDAGYMILGIDKVRDEE